MTNRKKIIVFVLCVVAAVFLTVSIILIWHGNTSIELNTIVIESERLPATFDGYRIAHVSDLHNAEMGKDNSDLLEVIKGSSPDIIAITGDIIDSRRTDIEVALDFAEKAVEIAPCFFVTGNHEARTDEYEELKNGLVERGVIVLDDSKIVINTAVDKLTVMGIDDLMCEKEYERLYPDELTAKKLDGLVEDTDGFTVLLAHRAYVFDTYAEYDIDLVLSGHAHGGQFRLPLLGGVYVPAQGFFPDYTEGLYTKNDTNMIVSRGIGNSIFPFRINNPPEVILVELYCK